MICSFWGQQNHAFSVSNTTVCNAALVFQHLVWCVHEPVVLNTYVMKLNVLFQRKGNIVRADFIRVVSYAGFIVSPMGTGEMVLVMNRPNPAGAGHWRVL